MNTSFIDAFSSSMNENAYLREEGNKYYVRRVKPAHYNTERIIQAAEACFFDLLDKSSAELSAESFGPEKRARRILLMGKLKAGLETCAVRIENSITKRWWYAILHFFGYQAKCPKGIQDLLIKVTEATSLSEIKASEESERSERPERIKIGQLPVVIHGLIRSMISFRDWMNLNLVTKATLISVNDYLDNPKNQFAFLLELAKVYDTDSLRFPKKEIKFTFNKYQSTVDLLLQNPGLDKFLADVGQGSFKMQFFGHLITNTARFVGPRGTQIDWRERQPEVIVKVIDLYMAYAGLSQLMTFLRENVWGKWSYFPLRTFFKMLTSEKIDVLFKRIEDGQESVEKFLETWLFPAILADLPQQCCSLSEYAGDASDWNKVIQLIHQKLPKFYLWKVITSGGKISGTIYSCKIGALVRFLESCRLLNEFSLNEDEQDRFIEDIAALLNRDHYGQQTKLEKLITGLIDHLNSLDDPLKEKKFLILIRAFVKSEKNLEFLHVLYTIKSGLFEEACEELKKEEGVKEFSYMQRYDIFNCQRYNCCCSKKENPLEYSARE